SNQNSLSPARKHVQILCNRPAIRRQKRGHVRSAQARDEIGPALRTTDHHDRGLDTGGGLSSRQPESTVRPHQVIESTAFRERLPLCNPGMYYSPRHEIGRSHLAPFQYLKQISVTIGPGTQIPTDGRLSTACPGQE